jgi:hypothetical protein
MFSKFQAAGKTKAAIKDQSSWKDQSISARKLNLTKYES